MNCSEAKDLLLPYLHGEAARSERALVRAHLDECAACRAELAEAENREADLRRALSCRADQARVPARAWSQLETRLQAERRPQKRRWFEALSGLTAGVTRLAASAMAILLMAVGGLQLVPRPAAIAPTPYIAESPSPEVISQPPLAQPMQRVAPLPAPELRAAADDAPVQRVTIPVTPMSGELADEAIAVKPCGACARPAPYTSVGVLIPIPIRLQVLEDGVMPDLPCAACVRVR